MLTVTLRMVIIFYILVSKARTKVDFVDLFKVRTQQLIAYPFLSGWQNTYKAVSCRPCLPRQQKAMLIHVLVFTVGNTLGSRSTATATSSAVPNSSKNWAVSSMSLNPVPISRKF
jgi:hypothetical protein